MNQYLFNHLALSHKRTRSLGVSPGALVATEDDLAYAKTASQMCKDGSFSMTYPCDQPNPWDALGSAAHQVAAGIYSISRTPKPKPRAAYRSAALLSVNVLQPLGIDTRASTGAIASGIAQQLVLGIPLDEIPFGDVPWKKLDGLWDKINWGVVSAGLSGLTNPSPNAFQISNSDTFTYDWKTGPAAGPGGGVTWKYLPWRLLGLPIPWRLIPWSLIDWSSVDLSGNPAQRGTVIAAAAKAVLTGNKPSTSGDKHTAKQGGVIPGVTRKHGSGTAVTPVMPLFTIPDVPGENKPSLVIDKSCESGTSINGKCTPVYDAGGDSDQSDSGAGGGGDDTGGGQEGAFCAYAGDDCAGLQVYVNNLQLQLDKGNFGPAGSKGEVGGRHQLALCKKELTTCGSGDGSGPGPGGGNGPGSGIENLAGEGPTPFTYFSLGGIGAAIGGMAGYFMGTGTGSTTTKTVIGAAVGGAVGLGIASIVGKSDKTPAPGTSAQSRVNGLAADKVRAFLVVGDPTAFDAESRARVRVLLIGDIPKSAVTSDGASTILDGIFKGSPSIPADVKAVADSLGSVGGGVFIFRPDGSLYSSSTTGPAIAFPGALGAALPSGPGRPGPLKPRAPVFEIDQYGNKVTKNGEKIIEEYAKIVNTITKVPVPTAKGAYLPGQEPSASCPPSVVIHTIHVDVGPACVVNPDSYFVYATSRNAALKQLRCVAYSLGLTDSDFDKMFNADTGGTESGNGTTAEAHCQDDLTWTGNGWHQWVPVGLSNMLRNKGML